MAFYKQFKLPPLRLTQLSGDTDTTKIIHRGEESRSAPVKTNSKLEDDNELPSCDVNELPEDFPSADEFVVPGLHELHSKASIKGWERLRSQILSVHTESSAMPQWQLCLLCPNTAEFRCRECGPNSFYCKECLNLMHRRANFFHTPEQWEVNLM